MDKVISGKLLEHGAVGIASVLGGVASAGCLDCPGKSGCAVARQDNLGATCRQAGLPTRKRQQG